MGFVTPLLLAGAGLVAIPIVLHLIMRREAQQLKFPALRFVQQRRTMNQHRLRLRHLLLLALRCAIIALLAFALARPTLRGSAAANKKDSPVATALVFDNSLRMQYQQQNESRLDRAKAIADWLLQQIPNESPVTVVDRAGRQRGQEMDHGAAELRVERLDLNAEVRPMADALNDAARWIEQKPDHRGEIYVFTDLAAEAWPESAVAELKQRLDEMPGTNVYLIDVGAEKPQNAGLGALRLSNERLAPGGLLRLDTDVNVLGNTSTDGSPNAEQVVELYVNNDLGQPEKRGQESIALDGNAQANVEFPSPSKSVRRPRCCCFRKRPRIRCSFARHSHRLLLPASRSRSSNAKWQRLARSNACHYRNTTQFAWPIRRRSPTPPGKHSLRMSTKAAALAFPSVATLAVMP
jgi:hypothetical protein